MSDKKVVDEVEVEEDLGLKDYLGKIAAKPSQQQIEEWKAEFGEVFVSGFSEEEMYIWRPVRRKEWVKLQSDFQDASLKAQEASDPSLMPTQFDMEDALLNLCLLWRSGGADWDNTKGGTVSSLHEQIMQKSNFLTSQGASLLVAKL